jgi:hypothetical protein
VQVIAPLLEPTYLLTSADNGVTFARTNLGDLPAVEKALPVPGGGLDVMSGSGPASFGRFGADGSGPGELPVEFGSATESLDTALAPFNSGLVSFFGGLATRSTIWNGVGDPNLQQNWVEGPRLGRGQTTPAAVGGRSGTWVAYIQRRDSGHATYVKRLRSNGKLGKARRLSRQDPVQMGFAQAPGGAMALVWGDGDDAWIVRSKNGRHWTRAKRLFRGNEPTDLRPALGRRGGWMVWDASAGNSGQHPIRIAALPRAPRR